jgi:hypothetical protein
MQYYDFDIAIGQISGRTYRVSVLRSPVGEAQELVDFPFDGTTLQHHLLKIENALLKSASRFRVVLSPEEKVVLDFGAALFDFIMHGLVGRIYYLSRDYCQREGKELRLKLRIEDPFLATLPWECLYDTRFNQFLVLSRATPLLRYLEVPRRLRPLLVTPPLRLLGMVANPRDLPSLDVELEKERITQAVASLQTEGLLELTWLEGQRASDLQRALRRETWHIFHFIGHGGGIDEGRNEGCLMLADDLGMAQQLGASNLARLLGDHDSLRVVILNTCGSSAIGSNTFGGIAPILVRGGIPVVLAMQYAISDTAAIHFAQTFYEALTDGLSVEISVTEARKSINLDNPRSIEWIAPAIFTSVPEGVLYQLTDRSLVSSYARSDPLVHSFLENAGFSISSLPQTNDILATPASSQSSQWTSRFSKGIYVKTIFDSVLDQQLVTSTCQDAKKYTNQALVIIDESPTLSAWMTIAGFRADDKSPFVLLPIDRSVLKEAVALRKESRMLRLYVDKHLGKDYNPYDVRDPVSDALSFFGREGLADELSTMLKMGRIVGLFGIHKMGKSSVLQRLRNKLKFPVAYIYLRKNDDLSGIYRRILNALTLEMKIKHSYSLPALPDNVALTQTDFEEAVYNLLNKIGKEPRLAIFLDEIEAIIPYEKGGEATLNLYVTLMDCLRGVQHETGQLALMVAGIYPSLGRVNYFWGEQKNPMHQIITERFLPPMSAEDCEIMVRSLGEQIRVTYDQETVDYIFNASGGHPFLARQLCSLAVEQHNDAGKIPFSLIEQVTTDFVRNPATASYFDDYGLWGELGKAVIWGESVSQANHHSLRQLAASHPTGLASNELKATAAHLPIEESLYALRERHVIKVHSETARYVITFGMFADWIRRNK